MAAIASITRQADDVGMVQVVFADGPAIIIEEHRVFDRDQFAEATRGMVRGLGGPVDPAGWRRHIETLLKKSEGGGITTAVCGCVSKWFPIEPR